MNFGILIETNEPEKAWNGVRFANASLKAGHAVRIFLMSCPLYSSPSPRDATLARMPSSALKKKS